MANYKTITNNKLELVKEPSNILGCKIKRSEDIYDFLKQIYNPKTIDLKESFFVVLLNRANNVIGYSEISQGGVAGTVVDNKILFSTILKTTMACAIVLTHNHPSGQLQPSGADLKITRTIKQIGDLLEITVLDHVIMTSDGYYSMADSGDLAGM